MCRFRTVTRHERSGSWHCDLSGDERGWPTTILPHIPMAAHPHPAHDTARSLQSGCMPDCFQRRLLLFAGLLLLAWTVAAVEAEEIMYRCEDGSFTNRPDAACPPYRPQGAVTVSPDGQPPPIIRDRLAGDNSVMTAVLPPPSGKLSKKGYTLCGLYDEWATLRQTTSGGTVFSHSRDVARWEALSRIFLSIGTPHCDVPSAVRAAQASR